MSLSSQMLDDQLAVLGYRAKDVVTDAGQFNKAAKGKKAPTAAIPSTAVGLNSPIKVMPPGL